jgi:hypothetical protein
MSQLELGGTNVQCPKCGASGREPCRREYKNRALKYVHRERILAEATAALEGK